MLCGGKESSGDNWCKHLKKYHPDQKLTKDIDYVLCTGDDCKYAHMHGVRGLKSGSASLAARS